MHTCHEHTIIMCLNCKLNSKAEFTDVAKELFYQNSCVIITDIIKPHKIFYRPHILVTYCKIGGRWVVVETLISCPNKLHFVRLFSNLHIE